MKVYKTLFENLKERGHEIYDEMNEKDNAKMCIKDTG
jgi:hypothetical protein